jgi:RNA ligase (TIGR02306 family)
MRKLASIQKILALEPIADADAIVKATVLGWQLVVKKDEFQIGDLCVYVEIDSILPDKPEFEFLKARGMRIRTIRLRGQVSQGICFPLSILPPDVSLEEDTDLTEVLGVEKYEMPIPAYLVGKIKGKFPSFIPKTDETRVQILQPLLDKYAGEKCYVTEKLDGSSVTYFLRNGEFGVCSRNLELLEDEENSYWTAARSLGVEEKLRSLGKNIAIQGELVGEGIQGNKLRIKGQAVYFFNAFDIDKFEYYNFDQFKMVMLDLQLASVPVVEEVYLLENNIQDVVNKAVMKSALRHEVWAEGIVIRPYAEKLDLILSTLIGNNGRLSFKAINPEFLLKYGE